MNRFYVYSHVRKTDGKCFYIGKGTGNRYKLAHRRNQYWHRIVNKHGFESIILVNNISEEKAFELEAEFCKQIGYENLCNVHMEDGWGGHSISEETRKKMSKPKSKSKKKGPMPEEQKQKLCVPRPGSGFKGIRPEQSKIKISNSHKGKKKPWVSDNNSKQVKCLEINKIFKSVKEASEYLNINPRSITNNIHGRSKSVKYFKQKITFKYLL